MTDERERELDRELGARGDFDVTPVGAMDRLIGELKQAHELMAVVERQVREDQARILKLERVAEAAREWLAGGGQGSYNLRNAIQALDEKTGSDS